MSHSKPQGSKHGKKVAVYNPEITVVVMFHIYMVVKNLYSSCSHHGEKMEQVIKLNGGAVL